LEGDLLASPLAELLGNQVVELHDVTRTLPAQLLVELRTTRPDPTS